MPREMSQAVEDALEQSRVSLILLFSIELSDGTVQRIWSGVGTLVYDSQNWLGVGAAGGISEVEENTDLKAAGVTFTLSGADPAQLSAALQSIEQGRDAKAWLAIRSLETGLIIDEAIPVWDGQTDVPIIKLDPEHGPIIEITSESDLIGLNRSSGRRYTQQDQARDFPGDLGFAFVHTLQNREIKFG